MSKKYYIYQPGFNAEDVKIKSPKLDMEITGSGVIFKNNEKILLHLRDEKSGILYPNMWSVFGGHAKRNEIPYQTLIREMYEELDINLKKKDLKPFFEFEEIWKGPKEGSHLFLVNANPYLEKMKLKGEGRDMFAFSKKEMRELENLVPYLDKYFDILWKAIETNKYFK